MAARSKRKRADDDDNDDDTHTITKHPRHHDAQTIDATAVLDILAIVDAQGLLDRYEPSLRTLLSDNHHPLTVLRAAVQQLLPISTRPRASPAPAADQQLRFCALASSLLDQAARHTAPLPPSLDSILPDQASTPRPLKYALVQHLPNQDYWTSLNSDSDLSSALKSLPTAHAELVAILPTPVEPQKSPVPTLATYAPVKSYPSIKPPPVQRTVSTGSFLDYGPWASFAPTFDHNAEVVGRAELGLACYASHERRQKRIHGSIQEVFSDPLVEPLLDQPNPPQVDLDEALHELLPPEEVALIKSALDTLELENAVQELLDRNRRSLVRLEDLQVKRLMMKDGENSKAEEGSEEWDLARGIMDSLTVLASLRPRTTSKTQPNTLLPPPKVLHTLHRTLALEPQPGWYGTLPATTATTRPSALRDDVTVKKASARAQAAAAAAATTAAPAVATPVATTTTTAATPVTMPYSGYTYAYGQSAQAAYRAATTTNGGATATATPYTPYTPQYYAYAPQMQPGQAGQGQVGQQSYYGGGQQQGYTAAAYSGWYNAHAAAHYQQQLQTQQQQGAASSGRGTPQPGMTMTMTPQPQAQVQPGTYGSFFGAAAATAAGTGAVRTPAVANTVYAPAQAGQAVLPAHLRGGTTAGAGAQAYYAYQPQVGR